MEQASLTEDVLTLRTADTDPPEKLVAGWVEGWDTTQARSAAQLADIASGDRHELAELLVAVRTLRGLRKRRKARRLPRPGEVALTRSLGGRSSTACDLGLGPR